MQYSNKPFYPIDMDYTFIMFVDFLDQEQPATKENKDKFKNSFPRYLPIHHYMDPQKTVVSQQVGRIAVSHDDWWKMHNEFFADERKFQNDYFVDNIEKAEWIPIY